jgi:hypothetical protein
MLLSAHLCLVPRLFLESLGLLSVRVSSHSELSSEREGSEVPVPGLAFACFYGEAGWPGAGMGPPRGRRRCCGAAAVPVRLPVRACVPLQLPTTRLGSAPRTRPRRARVPGRAGTAGPGGPRNSDPGPGSPGSFRFRLPWPWSRGLPSFLPAQSLARHGQVGTGRVWPRLSVKRVGGGRVRRTGTLPTRTGQSNERG